MNGPILSSNAIVFCSQYSLITYFGLKVLDFIDNPKNPTLIGLRELLSSSLIRGGGSKLSFGTVICSRSAKGSYNDVVFRMSN